MSPKDCAAVLQNLYACAGRPEMRVWYDDDGECYSVWGAFNSAAEQRYLKSEVEDLILSISNNLAKEAYRAHKEAHRRRPRAERGRTTSA
jgi:hypothetical protein